MRDVYLELWTLAFDTKWAAIFYKKAGLTDDKVRRYFGPLRQALDRHRKQAAEERLQGPKHHPALPGEERRRIKVVDQVSEAAAVGKTGSRLKKYSDTLGIALLKDAAAAGSPQLLEQAAVEDTLFLPRQWCPHPNSTVCIRIGGRSMYPLLDDGYVVAVDSFDADPARLVGCMVAARDPKGAITVKWLRKVGEDYMLMSQHTAPEYPPVLMAREPGWQVVGEVIWWIGRPPKS